MYFRRCAACCGFVLSGSTFQWSAVGAVARLRVPPSWVITPTGRTLCWLGPGDVRPLVVFRARTAALAGRSGVMYSWTLVISSTTEMFAERLDSAIYFGPFFSVISSASEMFAERLGQALCFGPLMGRTGRTSPRAGVSSPSFLTSLRSNFYVWYMMFGMPCINIYPQWGASKEPEDYNNIDTPSLTTRSTSAAVFSSPHHGSQVAEPE